MDDGYVIPGLNENWTFMGAKPMEWISGFVAAIVFQEIFITNLGKAMPIVLLVFIGIPILLAILRNAYPDEERGVRNHLMSLMGVSPPDIPKPAALQPIWSGLPMRALPKNTDYMQLNLDQVFILSDNEPEAT